MKEYAVIGLMSGTSLDGTDLAACRFTCQDSGWTFSIEQAVTIPYPSVWKKRLEEASDLSGKDLFALHNEYGRYLGLLVKDFISQTSFHPEYIASHGHTVFHRPELGYTLQIGNGASLAAVTGIPVICDFRSMDVALKGQGAPLVPIGDRMLFSRYACCLNLGGFSNLSYEQAGLRLAHDISPCNMALNLLARPLGFGYDPEGSLARKGVVDQTLLDQLDALPFYHQAPPKSLGREWFEKVFLPLLNQPGTDIFGRLRTVTEHIAQQTTLALPSENPGTLLITGGGAHNSFLIERIKDLTPWEIQVPDPLLVDFKEALVFAFLGVLRIAGTHNVLSSVTGASTDHCAGALYEPGYR